VSSESDKTLQQTIEEAEALYRDLDLGSVRIWKERTGGKAVGYLPVYVPREILDAAGILPVGLMGGGDQMEIIRGDAYFQSYICQIPRSTVEMALTGRLDCLDGFLFPSTCDVIRNLSGMWKLLCPDRYVRYLDLPQNFDPEVGGRYYVHDLRQLLEDMERLAGRCVTDEDLRTSIERYNRNRGAIARLEALRAAEPWKVPTSEMYLVLRASNLLPVDGHTQMVERYTEAAASSGRRPRDLSRVAVTGAFCEQPPLGLIKTLEQAGCCIVADDWVLGCRYLTQEIPLDGDPVTRLAEAFLQHSVPTACVYAPEGHRGERLVRLVRERSAEGVIFCAPSFCDPALLEQPMLQAAVEQAGIAYTAFKYSENLGQFQVIREQAGTFADSIKLWSEP
jgi:benzoyl-CoA reductase subunit C